MNLIPKKFLMMEAALLLKQWGKNNKPQHFKSHTMYHCMTNEMKKFDLWKRTMSCQLQAL